MGLSIAITVIFFLAVILILVAMLLFVKAKLSPAGKIKITINGEKEFEVDGGGTLLSTLGNQGIFLHLLVEEVELVCNVFVKCTQEVVVFCQLRSPISQEKRSRIIIDLDAR